MQRPAPHFLNITARTVDEAECVASVLLAILVAHLMDVGHISWAAYAGYMVMRGHVGDTISRGLLRLTGTVVGGMLALSLAPTLLTSVPLAAFAMLLMGLVSLYTTLTARRAYGWLFLGLTFQMVFLDKMEHPDIALSDFVESRILETVAGTAACMSVSLLSAITLRRIWPATRAPTAPGMGWHSDAFTLALQGGIALALLTILGSYFALPALAQSAITIMAVLLVPLRTPGTLHAAPVRLRIRHRLLGCIAGAAAAAVILFIAQGSAPILIAGTAIGVALGRHLENSDHPMRYAGMQFALAILVILVPDTYADAAVEPGFERLLGILLGMTLLEPVLILWAMVRPRRDDSAKSGDIARDRNDL